MPEYKYQLKIATSNPLAVAEILRISSQLDDDTNWGIEIVEKADDPPIDYVSNFLSVLEGKYEELLRINIARSDLSVWILYEYDDQCNLEFRPDDMERLGRKGIALCVSCWKHGDEIYL